MLPIRTLILLALLLLSGSTTAAEIFQELHMVIPRDKSSNEGKFLIGLYKELFQKVGVNLEITSCQPQTCALYVKKGIVDGELARTIFYEKHFPDLIRIQEATLTLEFAAYSINKDIWLKNFADLKQSNWRISYPRGYFQLDDILKDQNVIKVTHWNSALYLLMNNKIDVVIGVKSTIDLELKKDTFKSVRYAGTLEVIPLYIYLNKKHKLLAEQLTVELKNMKQSGRVDEIYHEFLLKNSL